MRWGRKDWSMDYGLEIDTGSFMSLIVPKQVIHL